MNEPIAGLSDLLAKAGIVAEQLSEVGRRWEGERYLYRTDPVLALLLRIEAIAGNRAENHMHAMSKLTAIGDLAREAAEKHTGKPFRNPIFP